MLITTKKLVTPVLKKLSVNDYSFNICNNPQVKIKDNSAVLHVTNHHIEDCIKNK